MKAVILETKDKFAAVLLDDGRIIQVKNQNYVIGQVIDVKQKPLFKNKKFSAVVAAAAVFIFCCGTGAWAYMTPYSYVSLDVNPSIEYSLNRFDTVIDVNAVNDDGETIIDEITTGNLVGENIEDAIMETVNQLSENGYFDGDVEGGIIIATSGENEEKADELATELEEVIENANEENGDTVEVEVISVGLARVQEAKALGVTPGKLNLVEKLQASAADPESINIEEWLAKPVKEIMKATKENKKAAKTVTGTETEAEQLQLQEQEQIQAQSTQQTKLQNKEQVKTEKQADNQGKSQTKKQDNANTDSTVSADITVLDTATEEAATSDAVVKSNNSNSNNKNKDTNTNNASENAGVKETKAQDNQSENASSNKNKKE